jgi:hypothetical protein
VLKLVLVAPPREEDIRHWQQLARIQADHAGEVDAAEDVLWSVFEAFPQRANALSGLEEFYRRHLGAARLSTRLGEWLSRRGDRLDGERLGQLWTYVGDLNLSVLKAWKEAESAYRQAEKSAAPTALLSARLGRALVRQDRGDRSAVPALLRALATPGLDEMILREILSDLDTTYATVRDSARLAVVRQVRRSLGETVELVESGVRRDPTRTVDPATLWELLGTQLGDSSSREVAVAMAPLAERVLARLAGVRRQLKGRRVRLDEPGTFEQALGLAGNTLGVTPSRVLVGDGADRALAIDLRTNWVPDIWLMDDSSLACRFWAGWCGGMQFAQGAPWTWADQQVAGQMLRALAARGLGKQDIEPGPFADDVAGIMLLPQRRAAALVLADSLEVLDGRPFAPGEWSEAMALRSGLMMAGDAGLALVCACAQSGVETSRMTQDALAVAVCTRPMVLSLLQFALSDAYQLLRYETGLGARPAV